MDAKVKAFVDAAESCGHETEEYGLGYKRMTHAVRVDSDKDLMEFFADMADDGFDIRTLRFDGCGRGYLVYPL